MKADDLNQRLGPKLFHQMKSATYHYRAIITLLLIVTACAYVRIPATNWGLPYQYPYDEPEIMLPAIRLLREGIYIPYKFDYGPLNGYLHAAWGSLSFIRGLGEDRFPDSIWGIQTENVTGWYWSVTSDWLLRQARYLSVLLSLIATTFIYMTAFHLWKRVLPAFWSACIIGFNAIFAYQTSLVTADATSIAAACVCVWSSIHIYTSRSPWAYIVAGIAAASAAAFKYNNVVIAALPIAAHFLGRTEPGKSSNGTLGLVRYLAVLLLFLTIFLFPIFLKPVKFLSDIGNVLSYYVVPQDSSLYSAATGYLQRALALLDTATVSTPGKSMKSYSEIQFSFTWYGLGVVLTVVAGIIYLAMRETKLLALLALTIVLNFINVGGDTGFFHSRYLLLSLPFFALCAGAATVPCVNATWAGKLPRTVIWIIALVLLLPYAYQPFKNMKTMSSTVDPRTALNDYLWKNIPKGKSLVILEETRWHHTPDSLRQWKVIKATVPLVMQNPSIVQNADYVIAPIVVFFHSPSEERMDRANRINSWLGQLKPIKKLGDQPIAFDGPDVQPAVQLVAAAEGLPDTKPVVPDNRADGISFSGPQGSTTLGNGVLGIRAGQTVYSKINVTTATRTVIVRAQGTSPYQQKVLPRIEIAFAPDLPDSTELVTKSIAMGRSQSGLQDYEAPLQVPPGTYKVAVSAKDEEYYLINLESVAVQP